MYRGFVIALATLLVSGCGSLRMLAHNEISVGGTPRSYQLFVPAGQEDHAALPLLLAFHGGGSDGRGLESLTSLADAAEVAGMLIVYADGVDGRWNDGRGISKQEDIAYVTALIEDVATRYKIDRQRVYAVGMGSGGIFALRLGCEVPERIAAVAAVLATMPDALTARCKAIRAVSVVLIAGNADPLVPWKGGSGLLGAEATFDYWAQRNNCGPVSSEKLAVEDTADPTRVVRYACSGRDASEVVLYEIEGGGHNWPRAFQYLPENDIGKTTHQFDANTAIVEFLVRFRLP